MDALEKAVDRAAEERRQQKVREEERRRCAAIARLAAQYSSNEAVKHAAEAIAVAIENPALGIP
jgi:hypothetical protein